MSLSSGTYYLIEFSRYHSGDIENWSDKRHTIDQVMACIKETMAAADKNSWSGKGSDEVMYKIFHVTAKQVFIEVKATYEVKVVE